MFQHVSDPKHQSTDVFTQSVLQTKDSELKMRNRKWAYACLSHFTPTQMSLIPFSQWMASRQSLLHRNKHKDEVSGSASNDLHTDVFSFKEFLKPHEGAREWLALCSDRALARGILAPVTLASEKLVECS